MLTISEVSVNFSGVRAVDGVSFTAVSGQVVGLIGPNGAGKSTLVNCVSGLTACAGSIRWMDRDLVGRAPERIARLGVARTFQHSRLFSGLTVLDNVMCGAHRYGRGTLFGAMIRSPATRRDQKALYDRAQSALELVGVEWRLQRRLVENLTAGQQRLVAVARAIASEPRLILLDEPAAGLTDKERGDLRDRLAMYFASSGVCALVVEHHMGFLMPLVSKVVVLAQGKVLAEGKPGEVRHDERVIRAYMGEP